MPSEPSPPDESLLGSPLPRAKSTNVTQGRKRRYLANDIPREPVQDLQMSLILDTTILRSNAVNFAASYSKLKEEKVALEEHVRKLAKESGTMQKEDAASKEHVEELEKENGILKEENCTLKEEKAAWKDEKIALKEQGGRLEKETSTWKEHFTAQVKKIEASGKRNALIKDRLVSPQRQFVGFQEY